ncbi:chromosome segregation in meiosis- protein [Haplosporangium sp. Z 767]|nr:chromosome segregation in meiosis- protein [Haplosporangium sp. Z 767]KAF9186500.1 chromosome segregation in meiosis- protein [Haplosporangium sp. Z 11]
MNDIPLEDEPFEQFDDYEDEMMQEAERQDQLMMQQQQPIHGTSSSLASDMLPQQKNFLGMLNADTQMTEGLLQQQREQLKNQAQAQAQAGRGRGSGGNRPIGSAARRGRGRGGLGPDGDLASVNVAKKRVKLVSLDAERLLSDQGLPKLMALGQRFKPRTKYRDAAEKQAIVKQNLADLMRIYQTWAHNLFPKATFHDFIVLAESRCRTDKQLRAYMNGMRDAHWDEVRAKKAAAEELVQAEQAAQDRQNSVWDEHSRELAARQIDERMDQHNVGEGSASSSSSTHPSLSSSIRDTTSSRPQSKSWATTAGPAPSRKGKERAVYNPSEAMRLAISEDEDDAENYEAAMDRMRISMNLRNAKQNEVQRRISNGSGVTMDMEHRDNNAQVAGRNGQLTARKNEINLDDYNSDVDEEEEEEDEPLFTHRALKLMEKFGKATDKDESMGKEPARSSTEEKVLLTAVEKKAVAPSDGNDDDVNGKMDYESPAIMNPTPLDLNVAPPLARQPDLPIAGRDHDIEDEDSVVVRRLPMKSRRALVLDDSDDDDS